MLRKPTQVMSWVIHAPTIVCHDFLCDSFFQGKLSLGYHVFLLCSLQVIRNFVTATPLSLIGWVGFSFTQARSVTALRFSWPPLPLASTLCWGTGRVLHEDNIWVRGMHVPVTLLFPVSSRHCFRLVQSQLSIPSPLLPTCRVTWAALDAFHTVQWLSSCGAVRRTWTSGVVDRCFLVTAAAAVPHMWGHSRYFMI